MFTKQQLELLVEILDATSEYNPESSLTIEFFATLEPKELKELRAAVRSALWVTSKQLSKTDQKAYEAAITQGKVTKLQGWTLASKLREEEEAKPKHDAVNAKGGSALLAALGLKKEGA